MTQGSKLLSKEKTILILFFNKYTLSSKGSKKRQRAGEM